MVFVMAELMDVKPECGPKHHGAGVIRFGFVVVNIHLSHLELALVLLGQLFNCGRNKAAGGTPHSPKINQSGKGGFDDLGLKALVA